MNHDHVDPLFQGIVNAVSGQRINIKLKKAKRMPDTQSLTAEQVEAQHKLLDLIHDLIQEVEAPHRQVRYERRYQLILDKLFPERVEWRNTKADGTQHG